MKRPPGEHSGATSPRGSGRTVLTLILIGLGVAVICFTMLGWWLLSGFGCEMNTAGCKRVRLDLSRDSLSIFLPMLALGGLLVAAGLRWRR